MKHLLHLLFLGSSVFPVRSQDSLHVIVHIIYGSKPKAPGETRWFGGKWGGHVGLEITPDRVVHFNPGGIVKAFNKDSDTGRFVVSSVAGFYCTFGCDSVKQLRVTIPVSASDSQQLDSISRQYLDHPPYPYAFFGMRCAAACYQLLSSASVYPEWKTGKMIRKFFYPRKLRKHLIRSAKKHQWKTQITPGRNSRKWDHD